MSLNLDAKGFIAIAFFVCVGLIVNFFGKKIISALDSKKACINSGLDSVEKQLKDSEKEYEALLQEEKNVKNFASQIIQSADQERISSLEKFKRDSEAEIQKKILKQKMINEKIHSEIQDEFDKISWNASCELLKETLIGEKFETEENQKLHENLINKFLTKVSS